MYATGQQKELGLGTQSGTRLANRLYYCYGLPTTSRDLLACEWGLKGNSQEKVVGAVLGWQSIMNSGLVVKL